jgi:hypothetical protein
MKLASSRARVTYIPPDKILHWSRFSQIEEQKIMKLLYIILVLSLFSDVI